MLSHSAPITKVEAVVVCRGAEPTGFFGPPAVPVLSENAFRSFLDRERNLTPLWALLNARADLSQASERFSEGKAKLELCGYEFVFPALAL